MYSTDSKPVRAARKVICRTVAQQVRAAVLYTAGRGFKSLSSYQNNMNIENESISDLCRSVRHKRRFRIRLPKKSGLYVPDYSAYVYMPGDIVVFSMPVVMSDVVFIAEIVHTTSSEDFSCTVIHRPKERDPSRKVSWIGSKIAIKRKMILCELLPELKLETIE